MSQRDQHADRFLRSDIKLGDHAGGPSFLAPADQVQLSCEGPNLK